MRKLSKTIENYIENIRKLSENHRKPSWIEMFLIEMVKAHSWLFPCKWSLLPESHTRYPHLSCPKRQQETGSLEWKTMEHFSGYKVCNKFRNWNSMKNKNDEHWLTLIKKRSNEICDRWFSSRICEWVQKHHMNFANQMQWDWSFWHEFGRTLVKFVSAVPPHCNGNPNPQLCGSFPSMEWPHGQQLVGATFPTSGCHPSQEFHCLTTGGFGIKLLDVHHHSLRKWWPHGKAGLVLGKALKSCACQRQLMLQKIVMTRFPFHANNTWSLQDALIQPNHHHKASHGLKDWPDPFHCLPFMFRHIWFKVQ